MLSNTTNVADAIRRGTALLGVRTPGANLSAAGVNHARTQLLPTVVAEPFTRPFAPRRDPAMVQQFAVMSGNLRTASMTRKQNVHKTRIGTGYGAMGPHPEREPA